MEKRNQARMDFKNSKNQMETRKLKGKKYFERGGGKTRFSN